MKRNTKIIALIVAVVVISFVYVNLMRQQNSIIVSTTTSLYDTGLLDAMENDYLAAFNIKLNIIAAGTGQALQAAERGDADVVLVHAPSTEYTFLLEGVVGARKIIAYNYFIVVGPADDPAGIKGLSAKDAFKKIATTGSLFISRADNSGTNTKELSIWKSDNINPSGKPWYLESGAGMGQTLTIASEKEAYTISDTGTYLKFETDKLINLVVLVDKTTDLLNVYSVMAVNPENNPNVKFDGALKFIDYLISGRGQSFIGDFGKDLYGVSLFTPTVQLLKDPSNPQIAQQIRGYAFLENSECPDRFRLGQEQLYL